MLILLLLLLAIIVFPERDTSALDEFCNLECWSRKNHGSTRY